MQLSTLLPTLLLAACTKATPLDESIAVTPADGQSNAGQTNVAVTESSAAAAEVAISNCSGRYNWYGNGEWAYTELQFCFVQRSASTVAVVKQREGQYWGGA